MTEVDAEIKELGEQEQEQRREAVAERRKDKSEDAGKEPFAEREP